MIQTSSETVVARKSQARSRLTNGSVTVLNADNRSAWSRRKRDLCELHLSDLGGVDNTSEAQRALISLAATLRVEVEQLDSRFSQAGGATAADLDLYSRVSGNLRRILESIGLERVQKPATLSELMDR